MYISPNTSIYLLKNVPLDSTNINTLSWERFGSLEQQKSAQLNYFLSKSVKKVEKSQYQRVDKGTLKIRATIKEVYSCNYLMFKNIYFEDKWFYAFVDKVTYVNNETVEIKYSLDYIQSWYFDYKYQECVIERTHSKIDTIGSNVQPEPLSTGEYVYNSNKKLDVDLDSMYVIVAIVDKTALGSTVYDGVFSGATLFAFTIGEAQLGGLDNFLNQYISKPEAVLSMYLVPKTAVGEIPPDHKLKGTKNSKIKNVSDSPISSGSSIDGYVPRNNKLYTYPYTFYQVTNGSGDSLILRYEYFTHGYKPTFQIASSITQPVTVTLRPFDYKGATLDGIISTDNTQVLTLSNYPLCSWGVDSYEAYVAQTSIPNSIKSAVAGAEIGISMLNPLMWTHGVTSTINMVTNMFSEAYTASIKADVCRGNIANGNITVGNNKQNFFGSKMSVTYEYARKIDDFFSRFGYAINKVEKPSRYNRQKFTYIKTVECAISGDLPQNHKKEIEKIHDNGITFFAFADDVGNYTIKNNVL